jgi:hypothetical protein
MGVGGWVGVASHWPSSLLLEGAGLVEPGCSTAAAWAGSKPRNAMLYACAWRQHTRKLCDGRTTFHTLGRSRWRIACQADRHMMLPRCAFSCLQDAARVARWQVHVDADRPRGPRAVPAGAAGRGGAQRQR